MKGIILSLSLLFSLNSLLSAQEHHHEHQHPSHEIGMIHGIVFIPENNETAYGFHIHLIHRLEYTKLGFGVSYERVFDQHGHNMFGFVTSYYPIEKWSLSVTPGFMYEDDSPSDRNFALHLETLYEFHLGNFHIGPTVGAAYTKEHYHISMGAHFAYAF